MDIIVETPTNSRVQFAFEPLRNSFRLMKAIPAGLAFPFDFGFIPSTKADNGEAMKTIVLSEFNTFPGCVIDCRIIGCVRGSEVSGHQKLRNDYFLAVPEQSMRYGTVKSIEDLPSQLMNEIKQFLSHYAKLEGKEFSMEPDLNESASIALLTGLG